MAGRDSQGRFTAGIKIDVIDRSSSWIRRITNNFEEMGRAGKAASKAFRLSADMKQSADNVAGFADDMARAVKKPIKTFMDFEAQMSKVRAATFNGDASAEAQKGYQDLAAEARRLGATTQFSGMEAAAGMEILATQGFNAAAQMAAMPGILDVAAASTESIATAADISTAAMTQFGLKAGDMGRVGDVLIKTANTSSTGLVDLGEALKMSGVAAKDAGISLETTTAMIGALGDAGVKGTMAGTAIRAMLLRLQAPDKKGKSALDFLGVNTKDKKGNLRPIEELLTEIDKAMDRKFGAGQGGKRRAALLKSLVGEEALSATSILTKKAGSGELQSAIASNMGAGGTAAAVAKDVSNNATGAAKELDSALEELYLTVGEKVIPEVVSLLKWTNDATNGFTTWAKENDGLVKTVAAVAGSLALVGFVVAPIIKGVGALVTVWGGLTWAFGAFSTASTVVVGGLKAVSAAAGVANLGMLPITGIILGIAGAAYLIYEYWEPISGFFSGVWESVTSGAKAALDWILDKINWVGEKIESFHISLMTEDDAAEYVKNKEALFNENKKQSGLFEDDLNADPNSETRTGASRFEDTSAAANNANYALNEIQGAMKQWMPGAVEGRQKDASDFANVMAGMSSFHAQAQGKPLMGDQAAGVSRIFDGNLMITIDSEGKVTKTDLTTQGEPPFEVRMNRGGQAA